MKPPHGHPWPSAGDTRWVGIQAFPARERWLEGGLGGLVVLIANTEV